MSTRTPAVSSSTVECPNHVTVMLIVLEVGRDLGVRDSPSEDEQHAGISRAEGEDGTGGSANDGIVWSTTRNRHGRGLTAPSPSFVTLAGAVLVGAGAKASASILGPALLAAVLTIALFPLARVAERRGWPSWAGGLLVLIGVYLVLLALVGSLVVAGARLTTILADYADEFRELSQSATSKLSELGVGSAEASAIEDGVDLARVADLLRDVLGSAGALLCRFWRWS